MSMPKFFDVHTHTQDKQYDTDREAVISRALEAGVGMIQVGTDFDMSKKAIELAEKYENVYPHTKDFGVGVYATVGLHPTDNTKEVFDYNEYKNLALASKKVVAIGECGLDYFRMKPFDEAQGKQKEKFIKQIELAQEIKKPLMIHCREAFGDLIEILRTKDYGLSTPGIVHFFSGSLDDAKMLLDMGFSFSFGGVITFTRPARNATHNVAGGDYDEQIKFIPLDRILLETDAPYVAPVPYRGKRNEPSYIVEIAKKIAEIKRATLEKVAQVTTQNAISIFGLLN